MQTALYFEKLEDNKVQCKLCPHECSLKPDQSGICRVRTNYKGILVAENYTKISAFHLDPIEKKPLYHFHPGSKIFSIGSVGCNLNCNFCQNHEISQTNVRDFRWEKDFTPDELVIRASETKNNIGIAFTYNEPIVFFEYMLEVAKRSRKMGMVNVMVSNGFINEEPLNELIPWIDAFNIDLKAFDYQFYIHQTGSQLEPVKRNLKHIRESGKHLEITNLVIPELNDNEPNFREMIHWIYQELGERTILHLSRYFPKYKSQKPPTNPFLLLKFREIALEKLKFVYLGNTDLSENINDTYCPNCFQILVKRFGYEIGTIGINEKGFCKKCNQKVINY